VSAPADELILEAIRRSAQSTIELLSEMPSRSPHLAAAFDGALALKLHLARELHFRPPESLDGEVVH
jgi:hypothetical protein